jgi:hypothetical protein
MPPSIPTSFIPHPSGAPRARYKSEFIGVLALVAYLLLVLTVVAAIGVFVYGGILAGQLTSKDAALATAEAGIDSAAVESFVRLRDRLTSGESLLDNHLALSGFFAALEQILPSSVRFSSLHIGVDSAGNVTLQGSGVAKSFNALAAASTAFSTDGRIKDAIFSGITVQKDNSVSFSLSATLDPTLIAFKAPALSAVPLVPSVPLATTTAKTSTTTP